MTKVSAPRRPAATPTAAALLAVLDGEHAAIRRRVRTILSRPEFAPVAEGLTRAEYRERVLAQARLLAAEGVVALGHPKEYGGGGNVGGGAAAFETLAFGDLSLLVKIGVQFGLFGGAVLHLGTREHHQRLLHDIITLDLPGSFAMTETGHGSDVQSIGTTATYDAQRREFVVHTPNDAARKDYIGNAACHARMAVVFAQLLVDGVAHGVHALLVPVRTEQGRPCRGVEIEDCGEKLGLNGVDNGRLRFDHVRVPRTSLLNRYADVGPDGTYTSSIENPNKRFFTMLGTLVQGRVCVGGGAISAAKSALTIALRYAERRRQFSPPGGGSEVRLLDYRTHQRRLLPLLATTYALHFAQADLVARFHRVFTDPDGSSDRDRRELETLAAGIKAVATWHATSTVQTCREACGGAGYLSVNRFAALKADSDVFTTFEGDNTVLLQLVGKSLLTDYKEHFGDLDPIGTVSFVAGRMYETVVERSALRELVGRLADDLVPTRNENVDLLDRDHQLELFRWREDHVLVGVAQRIRRHSKDHRDPFEVFLECQDHVLVAARAHVDRAVLEAFAAAVERCRDTGIATLLSRLCDLYFLANVEQDRGWFQEHARLSSPRSKAVTRMVGELCSELREHAGLLVDAFGIPDAMLAAPIGVRRSRARDAVAEKPSSNSG